MTPLTPVPTPLQIIAASGSHIELMIRDSEGPPQSVDDITASTGNPGNVGALAAAGVASQLHVCALSNRLAHAVRTSAGKWQSFASVPGHSWKGFTMVGCAGVIDELQVCVASPTAMVHTLRHADGSWLAVVDVLKSAGSIGAITGMAPACVSGELHIVASAGGTLRHAVRHADATWNRFQRSSRRPAPSPPRG